MSRVIGIGAEIERQRAIIDQFNREDLQAAVEDLKGVCKGRLPQAATDALVSLITSQQPTRAADLAPLAAALERLPPGAFRGEEEQSRHAAAFRRM